jgi:hypothetical protein
MEPTTVLGLRGYVVHLCRNNPNPIPIIQSIRQCLSRELQLLVFDKEIRDMIDESECLADTVNTRCAIHFSCDECRRFASAGRL